jgi:hypothetical protein
MGTGVSTGGPLSDATEEITFQIELVVLADGEIAGPDPSHYAAVLQGRKRAAEYVAKHVRLAKLEERDPTPVVAALRDMPHLRSDLLAHLVCEYARTYLRQSSMRAGLVDCTEAALKHLENRPNLPKFYRLDNLASPPSAGDTQTLRVRSIGALWLCDRIPSFDPSRLPGKSGFDQVRRFFDAAGYRGEVWTTVHSIQVIQNEGHIEMRVEQAIGKVSKWPTL